MTLTYELTRGRKITSVAEGRARYLRKYFFGNVDIIRAESFFAVSPPFRPLICALASYYDGSLVSMARRLGEPYYIHA